MPGRRDTRDRLRQELMDRGPDAPALEPDWLSPAQAARALATFLAEPAPNLKWAAVRAYGRAVAILAQTEPEKARETLRRLVWSLNEECGACALGAPEALGEALAQSRTMAGEYADILASLVCAHQMRLEFPPLLRGALWGLGRLAQEHPGVLTHRDPACFLRGLLVADDPQVRGLAAWGLGAWGGVEDLPALDGLQGDGGQWDFFDGRGLRSVSVERLAREAREAISRREART